jgi:two-component system response regulator HydG
LRALQERKARPLGGRAEAPFDVRFVAATNEDVTSAVRARRFREDLYFRINVIPIELPPLRARGDDVVLLARHFAVLFASRNGRPAPTFSDGAVARLREHSWPGNVRELQNCIEHAIALTDGDEILADDFPITFTTGSLRAPSAPRLEARSGGNKGEGLLPLAEVERRHILDVLGAVGGNKRLAARVLGVDRRTLYRKLETYEGAVVLPQGLAGPHGADADARDDVHPDAHADEA